MSNNMFIGPLTDSIVNSFVDEIKKKSNRDKIMNGVIEPILSDINHRYLPYVMGFTILIVIVIILLILILITNSKCCENCKANMK